MRNRAHLCSLVLCSAFFLIAAEPVWMKPFQTWSQEDARQILTTSPWSKSVVAQIISLEGEDARREGGSMGKPHGLGYDGLDDGKPRLKLPAGLGAGTDSGSVRKAPTIRLTIRWESALPIRVAEMKVPEAVSPSIPQAGYCIAVYGIPGAYFGDPKRLSDRLSSSTYLRREGKKDVRASSAEAIQLETGAAVIYFFPPTADIGLGDGFVEFTAIIGRIQISKAFTVGEMQLQGKLSL